MNISFQELRTNLQIRAKEIRVIDDKGVSLGIMKVPDAVKVAEERGFDLVEISPNAAPPVCKLLDYGKYRYEQIKKDKENKKKQHVIVIKEIQVRPNIDPHDLGIKLRHAEEFFAKGYKVKFVLRFRGREMEYKAKRGPEMTDKIINALSVNAELESQVVNEDKTIIFMMQPRKKQ